MTAGTDPFSTADNSNNITVSLVAFLLIPSVDELDKITFFVHWDTPYKADLQKSDR